MHDRATCAWTRLVLNTVKNTTANVVTSVARKETDMADRYIVQGQLSDNKPGYWNAGEWWADRDKAKVYKMKSAADKVVTEYGGEVIPLTSKLKNQSVYAYDLLEVVKMLRIHAKAEIEWDNADYRTYNRGTRYAYGAASKMIEDLLEEQGIDIDAELAFL